VLHLRYGLYLPRDASASGTPLPAPNTESPNSESIIHTRDAVSAPARYGRTNGKALRCHRCLYKKPVAKAWQCCGWRNAFLTGVRSPPLRGVDGPKRRPSGKEPEMARRVNFAEGRALRVRRDRSPRTPGHGFSDIESLAPATGANIFLDPEAGLEIYLVRVGGL
jgi:hypothetical protein